MLSNEEFIARANNMQNVKVFDVKDNVPFVFISYKSDDWRVVLDEIVRKLINDYGLRVYYDVNFDKDNELWCNNMLNAMKTGKCKGMLAFISKKYMSSYACAMEIFNTCSEDVLMMHKSKILPIIPIIIEQEINDIGLIADEVSSKRVEMKEWKDYDSILDDVLKNESVSEEIKKTISFLKKQNQNTTHEQLAMAMTAIIGDAHGRAYNNKIERWFSDLKDTIIKTFSDEVFDKNLINTCSYKERKDERISEVHSDEITSKKISEDEESSDNIDDKDFSITKNDIKNILPEIVKEISSEGKDVYAIDQKEEPHFFTKRMDEYLFNANKIKSRWRDDNLYRYEFKVLPGKIGIRLTPGTPGASEEVLNRMKNLHGLECVKGEGAKEKNVKEDFVFGCVFYKKYDFNEKINDNEKKELIKKCVLYALDIEQKIFDEINRETTSSNNCDIQKNIRENNSKSFNSDLTDDYINTHKSDADIIERETSAEKLYTEFSNKFSPEKLKELSGINLLRKIFLNDERTQDNICSVLEYGKDYVQFGSIKGGTALKHCLYYSAKDKSWKTGKPPVDVKNITEEEAISIGTKIRDNIVIACEIIEKYKENLKTEKDYKELYDEISRECNNVHKIIFVKKYFHMIYKDLFPCMFSSGYIRKVAEALKFEKCLDDFDYIGKIEAKKNQLQITNRVFAEIVYKFFEEENFKYQSC